MTKPSHPPPYTELMCRTPFTFLEGASHADELMLTAKALGMTALGITDRNSFAGIVRAHTAAKEHGIRLIVGVRLDFKDDVSLLVYPKNRLAYGRLTHLLTLGNRRAEKGDCHLYLTDFQPLSSDLEIILLPEGAAGPVPDVATVKQIAQKLESPLCLGATMRYNGDDDRRLEALATIAHKAETPLVALGDVRFHTASRGKLADIMTCIRTHKTVREAGYELTANKEAYLKRDSEMRRLFQAYSHAVDHTHKIANACRFNLDELRYNYPSEPVPAGETPQSQLEKLAWAGAHHRFPGEIPPKVMNSIRHELSLIKDLNYAPYFLTVHDIVAYARSRGILCQGRGSAANSVVCYVIGITAVNPIEVDLLFERFISAERDEPPDIDVDFEHARREEVIQYIYARYGRHRAGLAATVIRYKPRSAIREVGKVMGLSDDTISAMAGTVWGFGSKADERHVADAGIDTNNPLIAETLALTHELVGFPRHLSQHVGGFVLTETPLSDVVPIQNAAMADRTVVEWDKDDLEALGILKIDVLALGMLTALKGSFDMLEQCYGQRLSLATLPREDPISYTMLCRADSVGVFQVESRAQMNMLPRLRPRTFYDLVIQVAIVRPGPIQGDMVHPYLKRRSGEEAVSFPAPAPQYGPHDELKQVLGKTLGVPLFQEQAMKIAIVAAGFTPGEADRLRRAMATFRHTGQVGNFRQRFIEGMTSRGYEQDFAERCFSQIEGFGEYGFPESHAASFALLVYASAWVKCHFPAVFCASLLNAQPMGFYAPAQLVRDAREHGVEVRPPDISFSHWLSTLEPAPDNPHRFAVRLGLHQVKGLKEAEGLKLENARQRSPDFTDIPSLRHRSGLSLESLTKLAEADAFRSLGQDRRQALWTVKGLIKGADLPLFNGPDNRADDIPDEAEVHLPDMALSEHVVEDYQTLRLSLKAHPLSLLRGRLLAMGVTDANSVKALKDGTRVRVAGLVLVRQRPGSAKGVCFMTLEDEFGVVNTVVWQNKFEIYRPAVMGSRLALIDGKVQRTEDIIHIVADQVINASHLLIALSEPEREHTHNSQLPTNMPSRHPRNVRNLIPKSRDFH